MASPAQSSSSTQKLSFKPEVQDRAIGCLIGQAVGDALGTRYEFSDASEARQQIDKDMVYGHLPILGEGPFDLVPGQVTDDTELALGLARSLAIQRQFQISAVAHAYTHWYNSPPFDVGTTTGQALSKTNVEYSPAKNYAIIKTSSQKSNMKSQSNGCLMRISPLAIAGVRWSPQKLAQAAQLDCQLTNPNAITQDAVNVYVQAIRTAILTGDRHRVYTTAMACAQTPTVVSLLATAIKKAEPILVGVKPTKTQGPNMGYFGIAFQNAFYELMNGQDFEQSLVNIVKRGGDTDTNACIAGALLGAMYGRQRIPEDWQETVLTAKTEARVKEYPAVKTNDLPQLALFLLGVTEMNIMEPK